MNSHSLTTNEIVASLARSSSYNLVVEGKDDMTIFRFISERTGLNLLPCGGKANLLEVYKRRNEFKDSKVIFFVDKDLWVFQNIPEEYSEIIFTEGYSIENDIIADSKIFEFYSKTEINIYELAKSELAKWWANEIIAYKLKSETHFSSSIYQVLDGLKNNPPKPTVKNGLIKSEIENDSVYQSTLHEINRKFELVFRGHQLLQLHQYLFSITKDSAIRSLSKGLSSMVSILGDSPYLKNDISKIIESKETAE